MAPASSKVWAVRLGTGSEEVGGTLSLDGDILVFAMEEAELRIEIANITRAKRTRGSPILVVEHREEAGSASHAFFFTKPPPLKPKAGKSKRKNARQSIMYLQNRNRDLRPVVEAWAKAIAELQQEK